MTNNLQVFDGALGQVRTIIQGEDIWFVAKDVCDILEIKNSRDAMSKLDDDEKQNVALTDTSSRNPNTNIINESGLYSLMMTSRKPQAKAFKKWITSEVIPSIRKDGGYIVTTNEDDESTILARAVLLAQKTIERKTKELQEAKQIIEVQAPKVEKYDDYLETDSSLTVSQVVDKLREMNKKPEWIRSAQGLNKFLNEEGIQYKRGNSWYVYQKNEYLIEDGYIVL
ncbi:hypothetical protein KOW_00509 [Bacillus cereus VDM006]|nr:hypothetical protein KOW_00509 [Bacillus cereus VDM006]